MQKHQNIKAFFLLGIFSMLLLHQFVPHQHDDEHLHTEVAHSHNHGEQHEKHEKGISYKNFFDWFVNMHVHSNATTEVLVVKQISVKKTATEKEKLKSIASESLKLSIFKRYTSNEKWDQPPEKLQNAYSPDYLLRGPPNLG